MFYVYLLKSDKTDKFYIGYTDNLETRLAKHNQGEVKSTSPFPPWRIVYHGILIKRRCLRKRKSTKVLWPIGHGLPIKH